MHAQGTHERSPTTKKIGLSIHLRNFGSHVTIQHNMITLLHCVITNNLKHYSPQANVVCVVYDVTSKDSLERVSVVFFSFSIKRKEHLPYYFSQ